MSADGALVEAVEAPDQDMPVTLKRGSLQVGGRIAWKSGLRAGIEFVTGVDVLAWMSRQPESPQSRVDHIVSDLKASRRTADCAQPDGPAAGSLINELLELRLGLAQMGGTLVNDVILVVKHPEIQIIDVSIQRIDRMITRLRAELK